MEEAAADRLDTAGQHGGQSHETDIEVLDVRDFVGDHALEFIAV